MKLFKRIGVGLVIGLVLGSIGMGISGLVSKPFTFTNNTVANANQVNSDFDTLYTLVNGNLNSANVGSNKTGSGNFVLATSPTITSPSLSDPYASGTFTGTYTLGGTPTIASPTVTGTMSTATATFSGDVSLSASDLYVKHTVPGGGGSGGDGNIYFGVVSGGGTPKSSIVSRHTIAGYFLDFNNSGSTVLTLGPSGTASSSDFSTGVSIPSTSKFYLDGGGDTYLVETGANEVDLVVGAASHLHLNNTMSYIGSTGTTNTELVTSAGTLAVGGNVVTALNAELNLPNVDPPTANYANRNSFVKGWAHIDGSGNIISSYNVSSVTHIGTGNYAVNWNRDFSNANYAVIVTTWGLASGVVYAKSSTNDNNTAGIAYVQSINASSLAAADVGFDIIAIGTQ